MTSDNHSAPQQEAAIAEQAAQWLARRDRGLTAAEQDEYLQWLAADPRHATATTQHAAALQRLMALSEWQPGQGADPNPDLFAPSRRRIIRSRWRLATWTLAAAAAIALAALFLRGPSIADAPSLAAQQFTQKSFLLVNERLVLPDGSVIELKDGSAVVPHYSSTARRIRLSGEAHFTVAKDASRPFIVEAEGVAVRAIGTEFNVRIDGDLVDVLVTEGQVRVHSPAAPGTIDRAAIDSASTAAPLVSAGQRAVLSRAPAGSVQVSSVSMSQIADTLVWQGPRLQFSNTPLSVAVAEFNRRNRTQLVLGSRDLGTFTIGGVFRVTNVEGFVRLLEATLDVQATRRGEHEIVLTRTP